MEWVNTRVEESRNRSRCKLFLPQSCGTVIFAADTRFQVVWVNAGVEENKNRSRLKLFVPQSCVAVITDGYSRFQHILSHLT
jgi:hypothetical protein